VCLALFGHHRADSAAERAAAEGHCTSWVDLQAGGQSDRVLARALNAQRPHVLVDLLGLIAHNRHGALLLRPAPVQLAMVYAATTGGPGADLLLGDAVATPPELAAQVRPRPCRPPQRAPHACTP
jgi:predicted O-linked N-acetylglucosamine transferase (SPINDLY family)